MTGLVPRFRVLLLRRTDTSVYLLVFCTYDFAHLNYGGLDRAVLNNWPLRSKR